MGKPQKVILTVLTVLTLAALGAVIATWHWGNYRERLRAVRTAASKQQAALVDTRAFDTAEQLSQLAESRTEKGYAQEALRLGDYSVDAAFAAALQDAAASPASLTPETRQITERLKTEEAAVATDQNRIAQLTQQIAKGRANTKESLQQQLAVVQAQLELDQDDLDDAHQDLVRAGGDKQASVQQLLDQHEANQKTLAAQSAAGAAATAAPSIEQTKSASVVAQMQAWLSLNSKQNLLLQAQQNALDRQAKLAAAHDALEKDVAEEKSQKKIIRKRPSGAAKVASSKMTTPAGEESTSGNASPATTGTDEASGTGGASGTGAPSGTPAEGGTGGAARSAEQEPASATSASATSASATRAVTGTSDQPSGTDATLSYLKDLTIDQKNLTQLDKRIENEHELATLYGNWIRYVGFRKQAFLHGAFFSTFWILFIALFIFAANEGVQRFFSDLSPERRQLHALQTVVLFAVQALGIILILLVIFGTPSNFATVVALAGAGLTVALKDFIVGFFGWFVLMGKNGIRPGDWVEINGVGGEVLEVGLFRTMLLETGNWTDAGHPTGRKVTFVNSFAIEGHYFNFSTSGQWLWDEVQLQVPPEADPYPIADAIQKIVTDDTAANSKEAEMEWQRVVPLYAKRTFSAVPTVTVRPEGAGVNILVRYLTRARERPEVRTRLYRALIELLRQKNLPDVTPVSAKPTPADPSNSGQKTPPERA